MGITKTFFNDNLLLKLVYYTPLHFFKDKEHGGLNSYSKIIRYYSDNTSRLDNIFLFEVEYRFKGGNKVRKYTRNSETISI